MASSGKISGMTLAGAIDRTADKFEVTQGGVTKYATVNLMLGAITGAPLGTTDSQTVSNKTFGNTNIFTVKANGFTLQDPSDTSKQAVFSLAGITSSTTRTYILPNANGTLMDLASAQSATNKTFVSAILTTPTINNPTLNTDAISEFTTDNGVSIDGVSLKDGKLNTNSSVVTANVTDAAITPNKLVASSGTGWAWSNWTPTWVNLTPGNGTVSAKYTQIGKTVLFRIIVTFGTTTAIGGDTSFTAPVTATISGSNVVSRAVQFTQGATRNFGIILATSTTVFNVYADNAAGTYSTISALSSTVPFTWANANILDLNGAYEAA